MGRVAVPKTGQKNALPREDATEASVEGVPVPRTDRDRREKPVWKRETGLEERNRFEVAWKMLRHEGMPLRYL